MKKFLTILAVAGVMTACNSGSEETNGADTAAKVDSPVAPVVVDTTTAPVVDTTKAATDTAAKH